MNKTIRISIVTALLLVTGMTVTSAQVGSRSGKQNAQPKTLDDIRKMLNAPRENEWEKDFGINSGLAPANLGAEEMLKTEMGMDMEGGYGSESPPTPRDAALWKVQDLKRKLKTTKDSKQAVEQLRKALSDYFVRDMQHRVRELDDIKAKVAVTEAKLQRRLDSQEEAIDLQLKVLLREAAGEAFFHKDRRMPGGMQESLPSIEAPVLGSPVGNPGLKGAEDLPGQNGL